MKPLDFSQWTDPTDENRNALVFENRNKEYGAYAIRTNYNRNLIRSLVSGALLVLILFLIPSINKLFAKEIKIENVDGWVEFDRPPDEVKPDQPEEDKVENKKQEPLKSNEDNYYKQVVDEKILLDSMTMEEINKLKIGAGNHPKGDGEDFDLFPSILDGDSVVKLTLGAQPSTVPIWLPVMPEYVGGEEALFKFLSLNLEFPEKAKLVGKSAKLRVGFIIEKDGSVSDVKILNCSEADFGFEEESLRVMNLMPKWKPGEQNGHPARVRYNIPISFIAY